MQAADIAAASGQQPSQHLPVPDARSRTFWIGLLYGLISWLLVLLIPFGKKPKPA